MPKPQLYHGIQMNSNVNPGKNNSRYWIGRVPFKHYIITI